MTAYYNEIDPSAAESGGIAAGYTATTVKSALPHTMPFGHAVV